MSQSGPHGGEVWQFVAQSEDDTERLGIALADALRPGSIVALVGPLGAGKTRLVKAVAAHLGIERRDVSSPTFVLIHEYAGTLPIYHFDAYRLRDTDEFLELGAEELIDSQGVCLIEWADRVDAVLPPDRLTITIEAAGPQTRRFELNSGGSASRELLQTTRDAMLAGPGA